MNIPDPKIRLSQLVVFFLAALLVFGVILTMRNQKQIKVLTTNQNVIAQALVQNGILKVQQSPQPAQEKQPEKDPEIK